MNDEKNLDKLSKKLKTFEVIAYDEDGRVINRSTIQAMSSLAAHTMLPQLDNAASYFVKSID